VKNRNADTSIGERCLDETFHRGNSFLEDLVDNQLEKRVLQEINHLKIYDRDLCLTYSIKNNELPSKTVSTGPEISASHSKKFSSDIGPAIIPSGALSVSSVNRHKVVCIIIEQ